MRWLQQATRLSLLLVLLVELPLTSARSEATRAVDRSDLPRWDGEGGILLRPGREGQGITVAAVFEASEACFDTTSVHLAHLTGNGIALVSTPWDAAKVGFTYAVSKDHVRYWNFRRGNCRFEIVPQIKLRRGSAWIDAQSGNRSSAPRAPDKTFSSSLLIPTLPNVGIIEVDPRLAKWRPPLEVRWTGTSPSVFDGTDGACPSGAGVFAINTSGVYMTMAWSTVTAGGFLPGFRRDESGKTTALLFENNDCRLEISVRKEVLVDGRWVAVGLAPRPVPVENQ